MTVVGARPAALRRYVAAMEVEDVELREHAVRLRAVLEHYQARSPDMATNHAVVASDLEAVADVARELDRRVSWVAAAFERLDVGPTWLQRAAGIDETDRVVHVTAARFVQAHDRIVERWDEVDSLGELVVELDPREWTRLVWGTRGCPPVSGTYTGSGGVRGPDGRIYPLVIPELEVDGVLAHVSFEPDEEIDPATLGGRDDGWVAIDEKVGVARVLDYEPGWLGKASVFGAVTTGLSVTNQRWASSETLASVAFDSQGRPIIAEMPRRLPHDSRVSHEITPDDPTRRRQRRWPRHLRGRGGGGALELVAGAMEGAILASELDHAGTNLYRVVFEQHEDGSRRARMHTYQLSTTEAGSGFVPFMGYVEGGRLRRKLVTPAPARTSYMSQGPTDGRRSGRDHGAIGPPSPSASPVPGS